MTRVAEVPARVVGGAILVPARINQTDVEMQVDTGSTNSMIDESGAVRLGLPPDPHRRTIVHGVGGQVEAQNTMVESFEVGGQEWQSLSFATSHLPIAFHEAMPVAGILGADRLSDFDVELDIPHGRMTLWSVEQCAGNFALRGVPHYRVALERRRPDRLVAPVEIDGHPVEAQIAWGVEASIISSPTAAEIGVTPAMLAGDRSGRIWGSDRNENTFRVHRFAAFRVGGETFHAVHIQVADLHTQEVGMLLGADYARSRRIWLSYATNQMFVVPPNLAKRPSTGVFGATRMGPGP